MVLSNLRKLRPQQGGEDEDTATSEERGVSSAPFEAPPVLHVLKLHCCLLQVRSHSTKQSPTGFSRLTLHCANGMQVVEHIVGLAFKNVIHHNTLSTSKQFLHCILSTAF